MPRPAWGLAVLALVLLGANLVEHRWTFEDSAVGELPKGWTASKTGEGAGSVWKVTDDPTAPAGSKVLTQTSSEGPNRFFNVCTSDEPVLADVDISVALKALTGKLDQGGGPIWRFRDAKNYYICRLNPLEQDFRLFHVVDGKRTLIGEPVTVQEPVGKWHTIRVVQRGDHIQCWLNNTRHFNVHDKTLTEAGRVGVWTKADAVSSFDDLRVRSPQDAD